MENEQLFTAWKINQDRHKDIKDFLELNYNQYTAWSNLWDTVSVECGVWDTVS